MSEVKQEEAKQEDQQSAQASAPTWRSIIVDAVAILSLAALAYSGKVDAMMALTLIALIVGAKLPNRGGGGVLTLAAPAVSFFTHGATRP